MAFHDQFMAHFTAEEQSSDIVQLWNNIGVVTEKALVEEINTRIKEMSQISQFSVETLRSWLAFFLMKVRNVQATTTELTITCEQAAAAVQLPAGTVVLTDDGRTFYTATEVVLNQGQHSTVVAYQGNVSSLSGTYNGMIVYQVDNIDIDSIVLMINNKEVPACALTKSGSVPDNKFDIFYVIPRNGYYASYYNGTLYIRVYKGDLVDDPEGAGYVLTYRQSLGYAGKVAANQIVQFQESPTDINGDPVTITLSNTPSNNGLDAPQRWELMSMLRARFIAGINVSSIPEYKAWLLDQPSVGDCSVSRSSQQVVVQLLNREGENMTTDQWQSIASKLEQYKDIADLVQQSVSRTQHVIQVNYDATTDKVSFEAEARQIIRNYYDVLGSRSLGLSLFTGMDVSRIESDLLKLYSVTALRVTGYLQQFVVTTAPTVLEGGTIVFSVFLDLDSVSLYQTQGTLFYQLPDNSYKQLKNFIVAPGPNTSAGEYNLYSDVTQLGTYSVSQDSITIFDDAIMSDPDVGPGTYVIMLRLVPSDVATLPVADGYYRSLQPDNPDLVAALLGPSNVEGIVFVEKSSNRGKS